ncbi:hypothetical protein SYNPS1DRAFT_25597 [Syncephalis pseudoplumigaleata]|uniref:Uncharacterized protein n=1 Tax=Syncephalis pseudoplumigaleata TaxID=1712513 RepID=A0A4P9YRU8_9FUNG|nr:hypothetical protein SYNPS1DRAFT_25597 [Syncephalis pseudoplumigaleata]|eukprot:RKP22606.1 hypothetical protein SYNPS1DRAFT_25597 [Syncephalis pseudoplumigaleata]
MALVNVSVSAISVVLGLLTMGVHWVCRSRLVWSAAEMLTVYATLSQLARLVFFAIALMGPGHEQSTLMNFAYALPSVFLIAALLTYGYTIVAMYPPQHRHPSSTGFNPKANCFITIVFCAIAMLGYHCAALIAGSMQQEGKYAMERGCLRMLHLFMGVCCGASCLFVWYYGMQLHLLVVQRAGVLSQYAARDPSSQPLSPRNDKQATMARLKFSKKRGMFVQQIYNSSLLLVLASLLSGVGITLAVFIVILWEMIKETGQKGGSSDASVRRFTGRRTPGCAIVSVLTGKLLRRKPSVEHGVVDDSEFPYSIADVPLVDMPSEALCRPADSLEGLDACTETSCMLEKQATHVYGAGSLPGVDAVVVAASTLGFRGANVRVDAESAACLREDIDSESESAAMARGRQISWVRPQPRRNP